MALPCHRSRASCGYIVVWRMCFDAMPGLQVLQDKNPGSEAKCKEALIKLQQGREQAGTQMDNANRGFDSPTLLLGLHCEMTSVYFSQKRKESNARCAIDPVFVSPKELGDRARPFGMPEKQKSRSTQRICSRLLGYPLVPRCFF